jgi:hypothetical protein
MRIWRWPLVLIALAMIGTSSGAFGQVRSNDNWAKQTPAQIEDRIETKHPAAYFVLATKLFEQGKRDDAVFWFYAGQLRYRAYLVANPKLDPSGDPALFVSLFSTAGPTINGYAFGDVPQLVKTIDRVLEWDAKHPDPLTPKSAQRDEVRAGLTRLKEQVVLQREEIKIQRQMKKLENRN